MGAYVTKVYNEEPFVRSLLFAFTSSSLVISASAYAYFSGQSRTQIGMVAPMALVSIFVISKWIASGRKFIESTPTDLNGKVAIITGASAGIGKSLAKFLGNRGAHVILACRSPGKAEKALRYLKEHSTAGTFEVMDLDLASFNSIRKFASDFKSRSDNPRIDLLVNNAGVMRCPFSKTEDGIEMQFGTNHVGHFLLTHLLLPLVEASEGRIVNVSSIAQYRAIDGITIDKMSNEETYDPSEAYGVSKLANIHFTRELARRLEKKKSPVIVCALHPGGVMTDLGRHFSPFSIIFILFQAIGSMAFRTPDQGAQTSLYCCLSKDIKSGEYYSDCAPGTICEQARDEKAAKDLWVLSEKLTGI